MNDSVSDARKIGKGQRWKLVLQYDGLAFHGWQSQHDVATVQNSLEAALQSLCQCPVRCHVAGRTDQGVHALGQVAHADIPRVLAPERMRRAIQSHLKDTPIAIVAAEPVAETFHARFSATMRHYRYRIIQSPYPPILEHGRVWWIPRSLDMVAMQEGANYLLGYHDFSSFRAAGCQANHALRTLDRAEWHERITDTGAKEYTIDFSALSFLYHQVRNMVGTLAEVGTGQRKPEDIARILAAQDRKQAGRTAPPEGLYFVGVDYPSD